MQLTDRLALHSKLRDLNALSDALSEALLEDQGPLAIVALVDSLHSGAEDLLTQVMGIVRQPGELPFVGGNVRVDETLAARDTESQRAMADSHHVRADKLEQGAA